MQNDVRTQVTKRLLKEALHKMIENDHWQEVNVKSLCQASQISRATFYSHYHDIYELITEDEIDNLNNLQLKELVLSNRRGREFAEEMILRLLTHIDTHDKLYRFYFSALKENYMEIAIRDLLYRVASKMIEYEEQLSLEEAEMYVLYHSAGLIIVLHQWLDYGKQKPCTREEYSKKIVAIIFNYYQFSCSI